MWSWSIWGIARTSPMICSRLRKRNQRFSNLLSQHKSSKKCCSATIQTGQQTGVRKQQMICVCISPNKMKRTYIDLAETRARLAKEYLFNILRLDEILCPWMYHDKNNWGPKSQSSWHHTVPPLCHKLHARKNVTDREKTTFFFLRTAVNQRMLYSLFCRDIINIALRRIRLYSQNTMVRGHDTKSQPRTWHRSLPVAVVEH